MNAENQEKIEYGLATGLARITFLTNDLELARRELRTKNENRKECGQTPLRLVKVTTTVIVEEME